MSEPTIFARIVAGEIDADIVYRDEWVTAFRDIQPQAPVHILIVPNRAIATVNDLEEGDAEMLGQLLLVAKKVAAKLGVASSGYRLVINCNDDGGQEIYHLHMHLLGGKRLGRIVAL